MELPVKFKEQMKELLQEEYGDYLNSFDHDRYYGLRVNTLKISVEEFLKISPFKLKPIPWTNDGFYAIRNANYYVLFNDCNDCYYVTSCQCCC